MPITIIKEGSPKIEFIKKEFEDYINGLNKVGEINYGAYCSLFDYAIKCIENAYNLGKSEK